MTLHRPHFRLNHREAVVAAWAVMALLFAAEGLATFHLYVDGKDLATCVLVIIGWAKEGIRKVVEHFFEG